jgi:hypothetical protein
MGITKLLHIKERKTGNPSAGLINSIYYIMNPEKTQNQRLVGGNCGRDEELIYAKFKETKSLYGKSTGRQAYHFVISFPPEENVSTTTCMNVISDFVDEYLKNEYDVVFTVHDDQEHMHGHILFNSVNSINGKKYRYEDGDWEKYIQPITDRIAKKYGLNELEFIKKDEEPDIDWKNKIRSDISECIKAANNYEDFKERMHTEYNYTIREGYSKIYGVYLSYKPNGKRKSIRSYRLPKDCQPYDIARRIELRNSPVKVIPIVKKYYYSNAFYRKKVCSYLKWDKMSIYQKANALKVYKAAKLYHRNNGNKDWENERIIKGINQTMKKYKFMMINNIKTAEDLILLKQEYRLQLKEINGKIRKCKRKYKDFTLGEPSLFELYDEVVTLKEKEKLTSEEVIKLQDMDELVEVNYVGEVYQEYQNELQDLYYRKEKIKDYMKLIGGISSEMPYFKKQEAAQRKEKEENSEEDKKSKLSLLKR